MALYLVTGGSGFIGSNLVYHLVALGERVRVVDNLSTGREANLRPLLADPERRHQVEFLRGDITDPDLVHRAMADVDFVLHQAALPSVPRSIEHPLESDRVNAYGTLLLLEAARRQGRVRRFVLAASSSAYGERAPEEPKVETMPPAPLSPYAVTKVTAEYYLAVYHRIYGLPTVALRYFNIFGPRQDPTSQYAAAIPNFISAFLRGEPATIYGDGLQSRDFCFVDNAVEANLLACTTPADQVAGQVLNIACGEAITLLGVIDTLAEIFGRRIPPRHAPPRPGDIRHSLADISKARQLLGYTPKIKFAEGLRRTVAWYREQAG
ncbi:MAG: SDR family oxidoreductase [Myxococcales bacterium]|nr:SDR family oxidoreductase [Myxococcota bacterium]MDW8283092.1 SDR family oxidoreductase [Myxococcales bacterium]